MIIFFQPMNFVILMNVIGFR